MLHIDPVTDTTLPRVNPKRPRIKGIVAAARALGRSRQHLYEVLKGRRKSPPLLARYQALQPALGEQKVPVTLTHHALNQ